MRRHSASWVAVAVFALIVSPLPACAQSANASQNPDLEQASCGAPAANALNEARVRLATHDTESDRATLACLIAVIDTLNNRLNKLEAQPHELRAPLWTDDNAAPVR